MATKLVRLINDKKKSTNSQNESGFMSAAAGGKRGLRDVDNEELVSDLQAKLMDLEQQNKRLKENVWNSWIFWMKENKISFLSFNFVCFKLQISKVQLQTLQTQKNSVSTVYSNVTARIDTVIQFFYFTYLLFHIICVCVL